MKRFAGLVLLMALTTPAHAGSYSFVIGGHHIHLEASRNCRSLSCVSWSKIDKKRDRGDTVTVNADPAPAQAPVAAPVLVAAPAAVAAPLPVPVPAPVVPVAVQPPPPPPAPQPQIAPVQTPAPPAPVQQPAIPASAPATKPVEMRAVTITPAVVPPAPPPAPQAAPVVTADTKGDPKVDVKADVKDEPKPRVGFDLKPDAKLEPKVESKVETKPDTTGSVAKTLTEKAPAEKPQEKAPADKPAVATKPAPSKSTLQSEGDGVEAPIGDWQTEGSKGLVRIEPCGTALCGYMINSSTNAKGETVLINMKPKHSDKANSEWSGSIYSRASGNTYYATMTIKRSNTLRVEACVVGRYFCSGNNWTRITPKPNDVISPRETREASAEPVR